MKLSLLKRKSVVNVHNGNFIGYVTDVVISFPSGNITTLIVKPSVLKRIYKFFSINSKFHIDWENIVTIGKDVILVNIIDN